MHTEQGSRPLFFQFQVNTRCHHDWITYIFIMVAIEITLCMMGGKEMKKES